MYLIRALQLIIGEMNISYITFIRDSRVLEVEHLLDKRLFVQRMLVERPNARLLLLLINVMLVINNATYSSLEHETSISKYDLPSSKLIKEKKINTVLL